MRTRFCILAVLVGLAAGCVSPQQDELTDYRQLYHNPLVSPGVQFVSLPPAAQNTIRAESGAADIAAIQTFTNANRVVYMVQFARAAVYRPLFVGADGSLLTPDLRVEMGAPAEHYQVLTGSGSSTLKLADLLPPPVMWALEERAPLTEVAHLTRQSWGNHVVYVVSFKDSTHFPKLYIRDDGTVVSGPHT